MSISERIWFFLGGVVVTLMVWLAVSNVAGFGAVVGVAAYRQAPPPATIWALVSFALGMIVQNGLFDAVERDLAGRQARERARVRQTSRVAPPRRRRRKSVRI